MTLSRMAEDRPVHVHFLLMPRYPVLSLVTAQETLQSFNLLEGKEGYRWTIQASCCDRAKPSLGSGFPTGHSDTPPARPDIVVVVAGMEVERQICSQLLAQLRKYASHGIILMGLCTGAFVLARAGLMPRHKASIHWSYRDSFVECFPGVELSNRAYSFDGDRGSTVGGVAAIDLFLDLISRKHGRDISGALAEFINYKPIQELNSTQDVRLAGRFSVRHPVLRQVISIMENNIEEPLTCKEIADLTPISLRQIERLFLRQFKITPYNFYRDVRISRARSLLVQTSLSVTEIAFASGFKSVSTFSKLFHKTYSITPSQFRIVRTRNDKATYLSWCCRMNSNQSLPGL